ncbi:MAG: hypothetical protein ACTS3F_08085 [Phycisphaerales bacterium]
MNPLALLMLMWVAAGAEWGLRDALQLGATPIAPSFLFIVLVYVALWASPGASLWAGLLIGLTLDLLHQVPTTRGIDTVVLGPGAIGCIAASYLVVNMRAILLSRNIFTTPFVVLLAMSVAQVLIVTMLSVRDSYDAIEFGRAGAELLERLGSSAFTALLAIPLTPVLGLVRPAMGFPEPGRAVFGPG